MAMKRQAAACLALLVLTGCMRFRGEYTLAASRPIHQGVGQVVGPAVEGRSCFGIFRMLLSLDDPVYEEALDKALSKSPEADALVLVKTHDRGRCVTVRGLPFKFE